MEYQDKEGRVLYGFSQENLSETNAAIKKTNKYLQVLTGLFILLLIIVIYLLIWLEQHNVLTNLIYGP